MAIIRVSIHSSQFPEAVRSDLKESLRARRIRHKFHYDSIKQAAQWLALHEKYAPARTDPDCAATYESSFASAAETLGTEPVQVIGLGCGGGQKDLRLLERLAEAGSRKLAYVPCDVSSALVLTAARRAGSVVGPENCTPLVLDLERAENIVEVFPRPHATSRVITFFGMLPNFEPEPILNQLAELTGPEDCLLVSANLAPGEDYDAGIDRVRPLYENDLTREWLLTFLLDLGIDRGAGDLRFEVQGCPQGSGLKRLAVHFRFKNTGKARIDGETFEFGPGEELRLFFSYRHTPERLNTILRRFGLVVEEQWVTSSGEEGVFLCKLMPPA